MFTVLFMVCWGMVVKKVMVGTLSLVKLTSSIANLSSAVVGGLRPRSCRCEDFVGIVSGAVAAIYGRCHSFLGRDGRCDGRRFPGRCSRVVGRAVGGSVSGGRSFAPRGVLPGRYRFPGTRERELCSGVVGGLEGGSLRFFVGRGLVSSSGKVGRVLTVLGGGRPRSVRGSGRLRGVGAAEAPAGGVSYVKEGRSVAGLRGLLCGSGFIVLIGNLNKVKGARLSGRFCFRGGNRCGGVF